MESEKSDTGTEQGCMAVKGGVDSDKPLGIGRHFEDDKRKYWFVGGFAAGIMGTGTLGHWGIYFPDVALILLGTGLMFALLTAKKRGEWDV